MAKSWHLSPGLRRSSATKVQKAHRVLAVMPVMAKWYGSILVLLFDRERWPRNWKVLNVGVEHGIGCKHMQVLLTRSTGNGSHKEPTKGVRRRGNADRCF